MDCWIIGLFCRLEEGSSYLSVTPRQVKTMRKQCETIWYLSVTPRWVTFNLNTPVGSICIGASLSWWICTCDVLWCTYIMYHIWWISARLLSFLQCPTWEVVSTRRVNARWSANTKIQIHQYKNTKIPHTNYQNTKIPIHQYQTLPHVRAYINLVWVNPNPQTQAGHTSVLNLFHIDLKQDTLLPVVVDCCHVAQVIDEGDMVKMGGRHDQKWVE